MIGQWIVYVVIGMMGLPLLGFILIQVWNLRVVYLSGYYRILFTHEDGKLSPVLIRIKGTTNKFEYGGGMYDLPEKAGYSGRWRIPTVQYVWDKKEPIDVYNLKAQSKSTATGYREVSKQRLAGDLFDALKSKLIDETAFQMIVLIGLVIGFGATIFILMDKIDKLGKSLGGG